MLYLTKPKKVYFHLDPVDFRKQTNGLCAIVHGEFPNQSFESTWYVFVSRDRKRVKILYWRGAGFALWQFRLEKELFDLGQPRPQGSTSLPWQSLAKFLNGYKIFETKPHQRFNPKRFS